MRHSFALEQVMCLVVVTTPEPREIAACRKELEESYGEFRTPYLRALVRHDGWLLPDQLGPPGPFNVGDQIGAGFIHANQDSIGVGYMAWAFDVVAYGDADLVCRAMYVPAADRKTFFAGRPVDAAMRVLRRSCVTRKRIVQCFPFLDKWLADSQDRDRVYYKVGGPGERRKTDGQQRPVYHATRLQRAPSTSVSPEPMTPVVVVETPPESATLITRCWKDSREDEWQASVDHDGWRLPAPPGRLMSFDPGDTIERGFVHGYRHKTGDRAAAWAFETVAYGQDDLACRAMYIPDADQGDPFTCAQIRARIEQLASCAWTTRSAVAQWFPFLDPWLIRAQVRSRKSA